jgi:hypothetical protein
MYEHIIKEMAKKIGQALGINPPVTPKDLSKMQIIEETLKSYWKNRIAIVWTVADVQSDEVAGHDDNGPIEVSDEQAREVLQYVLHKFDAGVGVSWDVLRDTLSDLRQLEEQD